MEELEEQNKDKKTSQEDEAPAKENSATSNPSAIQVSQQWHVKETDQSLILSIDVSGFKLENLQLKVEGGLLSLQGQRTNSLGDVFELSRTKMIDPNIYHEAGIEARCDNEDEACSIVRITIPKKEYTPVGTIPIQYVECSNELSEELSATNTTSSVLQDNEKEQDSGGLEDDVFIPEAEIVFERHEEEESALGQVETVEDSSITGNVEAPQELYQSGASENTPNEEEEEVRTNDSDSTQSWEDVLVDGRQGQE